MPIFENPYINPVTVLHHATRHAEGGEDELTPEMIGIEDLELLPVALGGTGCTDEGQLETLIGTKFMSGYDANCKHAGKHKTGGSDALTAADIGACADNDSRLTNARTPTAHAVSHKFGGSDALTVADIKKYLQKALFWAEGGTELSIDYGGTGFNNDWSNQANLTKLRNFFNLCFMYYLQISEGGTPLKANWGGTGFNVSMLDVPAQANSMRSFFNSALTYYLLPDAGGTPLSQQWGGTGFALRPDAQNLSNIKNFFAQGLFYAFSANEFYSGSVLGTGIPVNSGGTGCTSEEQLETLIGTKFLSGYDTNCKHAGKHKTGGSDAMTAADIGACADNDSRLTNARIPTAHVDSHKTGGSDAITPAAIGACGDTDTRLSDARTPLGHSASHKTGGSDAITAADIGACVTSDTRLSDARTPLSHATTHETGGADELAPEDIGASAVGHTHAAYLAASFDDSTNYLTIGTKTFDLSSLVVP